MTATTERVAPGRPEPSLLVRTRWRFIPRGFAGAQRVVERNALEYKTGWVLFVSGFFEPTLFLLSIGLGVGGLVGKVRGPGGGLVDYQHFVGPALLAAAAMNGTVIDTTFNFYIKFKYAKVYDGMLATPLTVRDLVAGEVGWALLRGGIYAIVFLVTMLAFGLVASPWAVLAIPGAVLIGFAFAGGGLGATTYMRSWLDFDYVMLAIMPMFLFSGSFFPLSRYPDWLAWVIRCTPLYQGVAIERGLVLGVLDWTMLLNTAYLVAMGYVGHRVAARRLARILQP